MDKKRNAFYKKDARAAATAGSLKLKVSVCPSLSVSVSACLSGPFFSVCLSLWASVPVSSRCVRISVAFSSV